MFWVEGFDRFSYEWYLVKQCTTREEAEKILKEKREEQDRINGKYNSIADVYFLRDTYADVRSYY